ncbi:MAG TPA: hypothetical protein VGW37_17500, partial [Terriglobia bacterium]|nr:hypothetical protein [Terriglobia bacterium]
MTVSLILLMLTLTLLIAVSLPFWPRFFMRVSRCFSRFVLAIGSGCPETVARDSAGVRSLLRRVARASMAGAALMLLGATTAFAQAGQSAAGEANLKLPDFTKVDFLGVSGHNLLLFGILFCFFGLLFGLVMYKRLKNLPVHRAMGDISSLIWETCKTYL